MYLQSLQSASFEGHRSKDGGGDAGVASCGGDSGLAGEEEVEESVYAGSFHSYH